MNGNTTAGPGPRTSGDDREGRLRARREAVAAGLAEAGADALLVTDPRNIAYLTGFRGSAGVVVVEADGEAVLCTDSRYELQVADQAPGVVHEISRSYLEGALSHRPGRPGGRLAVEADDLTLSRVTALRKAFEATGTPETEIVETTGLVELARRVKDPAELESVARACHVADVAWQALLDGHLIAAGRTERAVAADLEHAMRRAGSEGVSFDTIVASGSNGALPHHEPDDRELREGDLVVVDFGALVDGYASDCTRTVAVGRIPDELAEAYDITLRAQLAGVDAIAPGMDCRELDAVSRDLIAAAGHGDHFGHSLGHGVGLDVHEAPAIASRATGRLLAGDVITIEPGIYLPGRGGVRIEDTVAVTATGHRALTTTPKDLVVV